MDWFVCKLCKRACLLKDDFILHKKMDHPLEYRKYKKERKKNKEKDSGVHHDVPKASPSSTNEIDPSVPDGVAAAAEKSEIKKETNVQNEHEYTEKTSSSSCFQNDFQHSEEKQYKCKSCNKSYNKMSRLDRHVKARHNSDKLLVTEKREKIKIITTTTTTTRVTSSPTSSRLFRCKFCNKQLSSAQRLRGHEKIHDLSMRASTTTTSSSSAVNNSWKCTKCNLDFPSSRLWTHHMNTHDEPPKKIVKSENDEEEDAENDITKNQPIINNNNNNFDPDYKNVQKALYTANCAPYLTSKMVQDKEKYYCNFCQKEFTNYSIALDHIPSHTKFRAFKCPTCPKDYLYERDRNKHQKLVRHGVSSNDFSCQRGGGGKKKSPTKQIISSSFTSAHRYPSSHVKKEGGSSSSPEKFPYRVIEGKKFYPCKFCPRIFPSVAQVVIHQNLHKGRNNKRTSNLTTTATSSLKNYQCRMCSKKYTNRANCIAHERREHTGDKPYECPQCDLAFPSWHDRYAHQQKIHGVSTKFGQKEKIKSSPSPPSSASMVRSKPPVVQQTFGGGRVFVCTSCVKVFGQKDEVITHVKSSHGVKDDDLWTISPSKKLSSSMGSSSSRQNNDDDLDKPYKCLYCPNRYMHLSTRVRHMRSNHLHSGGGGTVTKNLQKRSTLSRIFKRRKSKYSPLSSRPSKCPICQRKYSSVHSMRRHYRLHTGEKPYKCIEPNCGAVFSDQSSLRVHRINYHGISNNVTASSPSRRKGEEDVEDEIIGKNIMAIPRQQNRHKMYKCSYSHICDKTFAYNANRIKHEQTHLRNNRDRKISTGVSTSPRRHHHHQHVSKGKRSTHGFTKVSSDTYKSSPYISFHMDSDLKTLYQCNFCQKDFDRPSLAVIHTRSHTGERPHECPCGRNFMNPSHYNRHRRVCQVSRSNAA